MSDFGGYALDRRGDDGESCEKHRVPVARDDLRRDRLRHQAELLGDMGFDARVDVGECTDGAGNCAGGDLPFRRDESLAAAAKFGIGLRQFEAKGYWLGVDAMRAADRRREFMLERGSTESSQNGIDIAA